MAFSAEDFYESNTPEKCSQSNITSILKHSNNNNYQLAINRNHTPRRFKKDDYAFKTKPRTWSQPKYKFSPRESISSTNRQSQSQKKLDQFFTRASVSPGNNLNFFPNTPQIINEITETSENSENVENIPPEIDRKFRESQIIVSSGDLRIVDDISTDLQSISYFDRKSGVFEKASIPGLANLGNTCYINCSLHAIFNFKNFWILFEEKYKYIKISSKFTENPHAGIVNSLLKLYQDYQRSEIKSSSLEEFKEQFGKVYPSFNSSNPQDAPEFITCCLDSLKTSIEQVITEKEPNSIKDFFFTEITCLHRCENCGTTTQTDKCESSVIALAFPQSSDKPYISEAFQKHFTNSHTEESHTCKEDQEASAVRMDYILAEFSNALMIHINRHDLEAKIKGDIFPSDILTISTDKENIIREETDERVCKKMQYCLKSIICHQGDYFTNGHYISYVRYEKEKWYQCNDQDIEEVTYDFVIDHCPASSYIFAYELQLAEIC